MSKSFYSALKNRTEITINRFPTLLHAQRAEKIPHGQSTQKIVLSPEELVQVKNEITDIFRIKLSLFNQWVITDFSPDKKLFKIHYMTSNDPNEKIIPSSLWEIRGIVVDIEHKLILSRSYPYTPKINLFEAQIPSDFISTGEDKAIRFHDNDGNYHSEILKNSKFYPGQEGLIVTVFYSRGVVYHSSMTKLDITNSIFGDSPHFGEMWRECGGPADEELFDLRKRYSPHVFVFQMVHPGLLVCSKQEIKKPYIYLMTDKCYSLYNFVTCSGHPPTIQEGEFDSRTLNSILAPLKDKFPSPLEFNLKEANEFLNYGYLSLNKAQRIQIAYIDERVRPGEFIYMTATATRMLPGSLNIFEQEIAYILYPPSFSFRREVRGIDGNITQQYFRILDTNPPNIDKFYFRGTPEEKREAYQNRLKNYMDFFPLMEKYDIERDIGSKLIPQGISGEDLEKGNLPDEALNPPQVETMSIWYFPAPGRIRPKFDVKKNWKERYNNTWACFFMSVPLHQQGLVYMLYSLYLTSQDMILKTLQEIETKVKFQGQSVLVRQTLYELRVKIETKVISIMEGKGLAPDMANYRNEFMDQFMKRLKFLLYTIAPSKVYRYYSDVTSYRRAQVRATTKTLPLKHYTAYPEKFQTEEVELGGSGSAAAAAVEQNILADTLDINL